LRDAVDARSPERAVDDALDALEAYLRTEGATTAALIVEPLIQGAGGMAMYDSHYLHRARELTRRYDVHLIADEIMTGFGRTGTMFACEQAAITPDLLCLSKGITGGYLPLSCVLATDTVFDAFYDDDVARGFLHSHSYTGNALACRAALAVLDIFRDDDVIVANRATASRWRNIAAPLSTHSRVRNLRQRGMIIAFDALSERPGFPAWFAARAAAAELLLRPIGKTVYFMPPYVVTDAEFALLVERTLAILDEC
jgi:adenosylmethionine-8-amino-7-oxononanoate aminotransferase